MRLATLALLFLGATALGFSGWIGWRATADHRQWNELLSYAGKNVDRLEASKRERINTLIRLRVPLKGSNPTFTRGLAIVTLPSLQRAVIFEDPPGMGGRSIPSACDVRAHLFTLEGIYISTESLSIGWRMDWVSARATTQAEIGGDVIDVSSGDGMGGADIAHQFYALLMDRLVLVRLEDSSGKPVPNHYGAPNWTIGPRRVSATPIEWKLALGSADPVATLDALVWLGGTHLDPSIPPRSDVYHEDMAEAQLCEEVRNRPEVISRLRELATSSNKWIRDATLLALSPTRYR